MFKSKQTSGIYIPTNKKLTQALPIETIAQPEKVRIPLQQHRGGPAPALKVKLDQLVQIGEVIAEGTDPRSVNMHASITGKVAAIIDCADDQEPGKIAIEIEKTSDQCFVRKTVTLEEALTYPNETLINLIKEAGIVGLGGAAFPTHLKLTTPNDKTIETLIVNGAECEPYINADYRLMIEQIEDLLKGIRLIKKIVEPKQCYIAIEDHHPKAIRAISTLNNSDLNLAIKTLPTKYPQGDESLLIKSITKREVPVGGLPWDVGALVLNVSTVIAIKQAILDKQPLIDRIVTVSGAGVRQPKNMRIPIGTSLAELIAACGGLKQNADKIIIGGPMMGMGQVNLDRPVTKATNGVIVLPTQDKMDRQEKPCIRCGQCIEACPYGLQPELMFKLVRKDKLKKAKSNYLFSCRECGCCDFVCPARIPLAEIFRQGKIRINKDEV